MSSPLRLPANIAAALDGLRRGVIRLRVPILDGSIQVGTSRRLPTATIDVRTTGVRVTVRRTDGAALQAHIISCGPDGADTATAVFARPVDALTFQRQRGSAGWTVGTDRVRRQWALLQFVETVLTFSAAKQAAGPGGVARSA